MAQLLVRNLDPAVVNRLKRRAQGNRRSLQSEVKQILEMAAARLTMAEARMAANRIRRSLAGRRHSDSVALIREDRDR
jgi:plasmid stability protein